MPPITPGTTSANSHVVRILPAFQCANPEKTPVKTLAMFTVDTTVTGANPAASSIEAEKTPKPIPKVPSRSCPAAPTARTIRNRIASSIINLSFGLEPEDRVRWQFAESVLILTVPERKYVGRDMGPEARESPCSRALP